MCFRLSLVYDIISQGSVTTRLSREIFNGHFSTNYCRLSVKEFSKSGKGSNVENGTVLSTKQTTTTNGTDM